ATKNMKNLFPKNLFIHNLQTLRAAVAKVDALGSLVDVIKFPSTEWLLVAQLGVVFFTYIRPKFVAGRGGGQLPVYITHKPQIVISMERDANGNTFDDDFCFFRCIQHFKTTAHEDRRVLREIYDQYRARVPSADERCSGGFPERHLALAEEIYDVAI